MIFPSRNLEYTPHSLHSNSLNVPFPSYTADMENGKVWTKKRAEKRKKKTHLSKMYSAIKVIWDKEGKRVLEVYDDERSLHGS